MCSVPCGGGVRWRYRICGSQTCVQSGICNPGSCGLFFGILTLQYFNIYFIFNILTPKFMLFQVNTVPGKHLIVPERVVVESRSELGLVIQDIAVLLGNSWRALIVTPSPAQVLNIIVTLVHIGEPS